MTGEELGADPDSVYKRQKTHSCKAKTESHNRSGHMGSDFVPRDSSERCKLPPIHMNVRPPPPPPNRCLLGLHVLGVPSAGGEFD